MSYMVAFCDLPPATETARIKQSGPRDQPADCLLLTAYRDSAELHPQAALVVLGLVVLGRHPAVAGDTQQERAGRRRGPAARIDREAVAGHVGAAQLEALLAGERPIVEREARLGT